MSAAINLTGMIFGTRTVVERAGKDVRGKSLYLVRCECGREDVAPSDTIQRSSSCRDCNSGRKVSTHGMFGSTTYSSWQAMKTRCSNIFSKDYAAYGARGIVYCERWESFENFFEDMGTRPDGTTIDRYPDRYGDYEPGNCRWATLEEQAENKDQTILYVQHDGREMTLKAACRMEGIEYMTARYRLFHGLDWKVWHKGVKPS